MKNLVLYVALLGAGVSSCKEKDPQPVSQPDFTFRGVAASEVRLSTLDTCSLVNASRNAASVSWDLGNGTISTNARPVLLYDKAGTYTVTLTTTNQEGRRASVSKKVQVFDLVLKQIVVNRAYWSLTPIPYFNATWPTTETADIYVQIQALNKDSKFLPGGFVENAPIVFKSAVAKDVFQDTRTPIRIPVTDRMVLERQKFGRRAGNSYLVSLIAQNSDGKYCLLSNMFSGSSSGAMDDIMANKFSYELSQYSSVNLECAFE